MLYRKCFTGQLASGNSRKKTKNEVYNEAVGDRTTLSGLYRALQSALAENDEIYKNAPVYHNFRAGDVHHSQADISKATTNLSYVSEYHIKEGIVKSMSWYIKNVS